MSVFRLEDLSNLDDNGNFQKLKAGQYVGILTSIEVVESGSSKSKGFVFHYSIDGYTLKDRVWRIGKDGFANPSYRASMAALLLKFGFTKNQVLNNEFELPEVNKNGSLKSIGSFTALIDSEAKLGIKVKINDKGYPEIEKTFKHSIPVDVSDVDADDDNDGDNSAEVKQVEVTTKPTNKRKRIIAPTPVDDNNNNEPGAMTDENTDPNPPNTNASKAKSKGRSSKILTSPGPNTN